ncbi:hypothetical protein E2C01_034486 [Portunus trituberculatus]|uniref:Uncharacterized protein n=1 Tax=Portunus trituberculatus TaxID=210409 RepID=A0A5B7F2Z2_PORTR|nr:hypothetical protein [Portunus trituberculatus]
MNHSDVKMAWRQASACLSLVVWVCCTNVCVVSAKGKSPVHSKGPISDRLATASDIGNVTAPSSTLPAADTARKILLTTDDGTDSQQEAENSHRHVGSSVKNSSDGEAPVTEAASKRNTSVQGGGSGGDGGVSAIIRGLPPSSSSSSATAEQLRSATSLAGTLALLLISVVIAGALFVMVICFIHKWRENMGTGIKVNTSKKINAGCQCLHPSQAHAVAVHLLVKDVIIHLRFLCFLHFHGIFHILFWYYIFHWCCLEKLQHGGLALFLGKFILHHCLAEECVHGSGAPTNWLAVELWCAV